MDSPQAPGAPSVPDKLRDGPCASVFELLESCRRSKGIRQDRAKAALTGCVSETDRLISCIHKHPAYFHAR